MTKTCAMIVTGMLLMSVLVACGGTGKGPQATKVQPKGHPQLSAAERLQPCYQCHKEVTPGIYEEWYESRHGIGQVRCFQCHGGYDDFKVVPDRSRCGICHMKALENCPPDKSCWACHPAHEFTRKKEGGLHGTGGRKHGAH